MADKKKKNAPDAASLAPAELKNELRAALDKRMKLAFQHNVNPLKNPLELRDLRRQIARLKTHLRQKEAAK